MLAKQTVVSVCHYGLFLYVVFCVSTLISTMTGCLNWWMNTVPYAWYLVIMSEIMKHIICKLLMIMYVYLHQNYLIQLTSWLSRADMIWFCVDRIAKKRRCSPAWVLRLLCSWNRCSLSNWHQFARWCHTQDHSTNCEIVQSNCAKY